MTKCRAPGSLPSLPRSRLTMPSAPWEPVARPGKPAVAWGSFGQPSRHEGNHRTRAAAKGSRREICSDRRPFPAARMSFALGNCAQTLQFGRPYFVPTMQRATPGILTLPSSS